MFALRSFSSGSISRVSRVSCVSGLRRAYSISHRRRLGCALVCGTSARLRRPPPADSSTVAQ
eukprot:1183500-Prorocentrum_minimum.AAC.2